MSDIIPNETSRYLLGEEITMPDGSITWVPPPPVRALNLPDDIMHEIEERDTLFTLAARYYRGIQRPCGLWWVIADYQSPPISDPLLPLVPGRRLRIPSRRALETIILNEDRREVPPEMLAAQMQSR